MKDVLSREILPQFSARGAHHAHFRGDDHFLSIPRQNDAQERLAAAEAVRIGCVEKGDSELTGPTDGRERFVIEGMTPAERRARCFGLAANSPAAEADGADSNSCSAQIAVLHQRRTCFTSSISLKERRKPSVSLS